mgnify:CR=1 FL=1
MRTEIRVNRYKKSATTAKKVVTDVMTVRERHALIAALQRS